MSLSVVNYFSLIEQSCIYWSYHDVDAFDLSDCSLETQNMCFAEESPVHIKCFKVPFTAHLETLNLAMMWFSENPTLLQ